MRIARKAQLKEGDTTHTIWRGHNKEHIFKVGYKQVYLSMLAEHLEKSDVLLHSFCMMSNHNHLGNRVKTVTGYSLLLKNTHGDFARQYNDKEDRSGAVGNGRPKSLVIQDDRHLMNFTFYGDANPVRAGIVKHPAHYKWSSHNFYANGRRLKGSPKLTLPDWYIRLGATPSERQRKYRSLCDSYLRREGLVPKPGMTRGYYIGDPAWMTERTQRHCTSGDRSTEKALDVQTDTS